MTRRDDEARLRHMRDAARDATAFAQGNTRRNLDSDRQLLLALLKCIEIIGEAANHISESTRDELPDIPWADIIGMRHRLIHVYFDIDVDLVWITVERDLPPLIERLDKALDEQATGKE